MSEVPKVEMIKVRGQFTEQDDSTLPWDSPEMEACREETAKLLELLIRGVVPKGEEIKVTYAKGERTTVYKVQCQKLHYGHLLGKQGKMIEALRKVISTITIRKGFRSIIEIPYF